MKNLKVWVLGAVCATAAIASVVFASDNVSSENGVVRQLTLNRWSVAKVGSEANSGTLSTTNAVQTVPGMVGKVVFVPGAITDKLKIYNGDDGTEATDANLIFETGTANSPTIPSSTSALMANSSTQAQVFDLTPGWSATDGIVTIITRTGNTSTQSKAYISYSANSVP